MQLSFDKCEKISWESNWDLQDRLHKDIMQENKHFLKNNVCTNLLAWQRTHRSWAAESGCLHTPSHGSPAAPPLRCPRRKRAGGKPSPLSSPGLPRLKNSNQLFFKPEVLLQLKFYLNLPDSEKNSTRFQI